MAITNDDPFFDESSDRDRNKVESQVWCADVLARSVRKAKQSRADLRDRLSLQSVAAGMPAALTGGELRNQPARAVVAICDGNYRLLAFTAGVPDTAVLLTLIEDAEEVRSLRQMHERASEQLVAAIAQRSGERISRLWRSALEEMLVAMGAGNLGAGNLNENADIPGAMAQRQLGRLTLLWETYAATYAADVKLRFGLTEAADRTRLVILEQHPQTRRPWCESMIPFFADNDFSTLWKPLCESLWGIEPIVKNVDATELLDWWDSQIETDAVVLSLLPPPLFRRDPWPPADLDGTTTKRGIGWHDLQQLVVQLPHRTIDAQQLSVLIRSRDLTAVDIQLPTTARYLFFEPKKKTAVVIRQGDPPGRFVARLKRAR